MLQVVRPLVRLDGDRALQKRAYRVLAALCEHKRETFLTPENVEDLLPLLTDSLLTCHVSGAFVGLAPHATPPNAAQCQAGDYWL